MAATQNETTMRNYTKIILICIILNSCVRHENKSTEKISEATVSNDTIIKDKCYEIGKLIFENNCASCHATDKKLVAPPFQKIRNAYGLDWCVSFINNNEKMIMNNDTKANYIYLSYNKQIMTKFPALDKNTINCILEYVDSFKIIDSSYYEHYKYSESEMKAKINDLEN
ncbi:MAG: cytochrome c [Chitinophagales bacterium]